MATKLISEKRWYYRLIPKKDAKTRGLFEDYSRSSLKNKLVVCLKDSQNYLFFTVFDTPSQFYRYSLKFKEKYRGFFEVILGENPQKTHFDVDIKYTPEEEENSCQKHETIKDQLISGILKTYQDLKISLNLNEDVLVFASHGLGKRSFHIIVDCYCHSNHHEAEEIYNRTIGHVDQEYHQYIDGSVYKIIQQFRMLGSQKFGSGRKKVWLNPFSFQGQTYHNNLFDRFEGKIKELRILEHSLVGNTGECSLVAGMAVVVAKKRVSVQDIDDFTAKSGVLLLGKNLKMSVRDDRFPFSFRGVSGNVVMLKRERPSWCFVCQRQHENENPFLIISENKVTLYCRRKKNQGYFLGTLEESEIQKSLGEKEETKEIKKKTVPVGFFGLKRKKRTEKQEVQERSEGSQKEVEKEILTDPAEELRKKLLSLPRIGQEKQSKTVKNKKKEIKSKIDIGSFF